MDPRTDAEVFDMIHGAFGIGDYNPDDPTPWHRFRMVEISKIKAIRLKRRWSFADFATTARYCKRHRHRIEKTWDLLQHYGAARLESIDTARAQRDVRVEAAVNAEREAQQPDWEAWVARLELSAGSGRVALLEEWATTRQRTLSPP